MKYCSSQIGDQTGQHKAKTLGFVLLGIEIKNRKCRSSDDFCIVEYKHPKQTQFLWVLISWGNYFFKWHEIYPHWVLNIQYCIAIYMHMVVE